MIQGRTRPFAHSFTHHFSNSPVCVLPAYIAGDKKGVELLDNVPNTRLQCKIFWTARHQASPSTWALQVEYYCCPRTGVGLGMTMKPVVQMFDGGVDMELAHHGH